MPPFQPLQPKSPPPGHRRVTKRLSDGTTKEYFYPKGRHRPRYQEGTVGGLIVAFRQSPEWDALNPKTQVNYGIYLRVWEEIPDVLVAEIRRKQVLELRDAIAKSRGKAAATVFVRVTSILLGWAVGREWIESNPAYKIKALESGSLPAWTAEQADQASALLPEPYRRVVILARYTGQRRGDLIRMRWEDWRGGLIHVVQEKTGVALAIPVHRVLHQELMRWKQEAKSDLILTTHTGRQWNGEHLSHMLPIALARIGLPALGAHGLRKLAATELAEAGCSTHEIAAITGHKSLSMVQHYTASHDQRKLAEAAINRLSEQTNNRQPKLRKSKRIR